MDVKINRTTKTVLLRHVQPGEIVEMASGGALVLYFNSHNDTVQGWNFELKKFVEIHMDNECRRVREMRIEYDV